LRRHIKAALKRARGRIEGPRGVAAMLEINPHTLRARMRKLKIDWSEFRED
jgi:transcriptional regulator with GAF, ATPase, and Fis domain